MRRNIYKCKMSDSLEGQEVYDEIKGKEEASACPQLQAKGKNGRKDQKVRTELGLRP